MAALETAGLRVKVAYARGPADVVSVDALVPSGATLREAIELSGILSRVPELDPSAIDAGIFGQARSLDTTVRNGDRIEIYRPLLIEPKEARRLRAALRRASPGR